MHTFDTLTELQSANGENFGPSQPVEFSQELIDRFAEISGDRQWIHVDPLRAAASAYGGTIAHGLLTLSMIPTFSRELFEFRFAESRVNYGFDRVRYPSPVISGSNIRAVATIVGVRDTTESAAVTIRYTMTAESSSRPACVADMIVLLRH